MCQPTQTAWCGLLGTSVSSKESPGDASDKSHGSALGPDWHDGLHMQGVIQVCAAIARLNFIVYDSFWIRKALVHNFVSLSGQKSSRSYRVWSWSVKCYIIRGMQAATKVLVMLAIRKLSAGLIASFIYLSLTPLAPDHESPIPGASTCNWMAVKSLVLASNSTRIWSSSFSSSAVDSVDWLNWQLNEGNKTKQPASSRSWHQDRKLFK